MRWIRVLFPHDGSLSCPPYYAILSPTQTRKSLWLSWSSFHPVAQSPTLAYILYGWGYQHVPYLNSCHEHAAGIITLYSTYFWPCTVPGERDLDSRCYINTSKLWDSRRAWQSSSFHLSLGKALAKLYVDEVSKALSRNYTLGWSQGWRVRSPIAW